MTRLEGMQKRVEAIAAARRAAGIVGNLDLSPEGIEKRRPEWERRRQMIVKRKESK